MKPASQRGFTLIEVLVAITLMALVSIMAWRGLSQVASAQTWLERDARDNDTVARTLGQLQRDLDMAAQGGTPGDGANGGAGAPAVGAGGAGAPAVGVAGGPVAAAGTGSRDAALESGVDVLVPLGAPPELRLIRATADADGRWQRVEWRLRNNALWRYSGAAGDRYPLPPPASGAALMEDVSAWSVRAWVDARGWTPLPLASAARVTGLEITIERRVNGAAPERYTRVVVLR
jgi:general secretion pathway protein J